MLSYMHCILWFAYTLHQYLSNFVWSKFFLPSNLFAFNGLILFKRTASKSNVVCRDSSNVDRAGNENDRKSTSDDCFSVFDWVSGGIKPLNGGKFEFLRLTFVVCDMSFLIAFQISHVFLTDISVSVLCGISLHILEMI
jgi:hypothetical protein